jgi:NADH dehydrogenase/NADH:ubiquinone oxidoreductase subunit G
MQALSEKGLKAEKALEDSIAGAAAASEDITKAAELVAAAAGPLVLSSPSLFAAASNLSMMKGKAISVPVESNARGVAFMGFEGSGKSYSEMTSKGGLKALYAMGEVPVAHRPKVDFLIAAHSHLTPLAKEADVVLPAASFFEYSGTMLDFMGRFKHLPKIVEPQGEAKDHVEILVALAEKMEAKLKRPTESEVKKNFKPSKPAAMPFEKKKFEYSAEDLVESINASVINGSRLLWLKETEKAVSA